MDRIRRAALAAASAVTAAATLLAVTITPALADATAVDDGRDARPSLNDILSVDASYDGARVRVKTRVPDLRRRARAGLTLYFDTDRGRRGPEYGIGLPLFRGGDYYLWRMRNWRYVGDMPVNCPVDLALRWRRDVAVLTAAASCFGTPDRLRLGMRMNDQVSRDRVVRDWLGPRRGWTVWLSGAA